MLNLRHDLDHRTCGLLSVMCVCFAILGCGSGDETQVSQTQAVGEALVTDQQVQDKDSPQEESAAQTAITNTKPPANGPKKLYDITFDDLKLTMPAGSKFSKDLLTDRVKELDNQRVKLAGFIHAGTVFKNNDLDKFVFVMNPECKFGPDGEAFCVIIVNLEGVTTDFTLKPITVEGQLRVDPYTDQDGIAYAVYRMVCDRVTH